MNDNERYKIFDKAITYFAVIQTILLVVIFYYILSIIIGVEGIKNFETIMISFLKSIIILIILIFLVVIIVWLAKKDQSVIVQPFEVVNDNETSQSNTIPQLLIAELQRIEQIYKKVESKSKKTNGPKMTLDNLTNKIGKLPLTRVGSTSVPLGQLLIILKGFLHGNDSDHFLRGCLQKYGSITSLVAYMKYNGPHAWVIKDEVSDEQIPYLVRDLSLQIYHELAKDPPTKTWIGFKHFTEALNFYNQYELTKDTNSLAIASDNCLKAATYEHESKDIFWLLCNIILAYNTVKMHGKSLILLKYVAKRRPDDVLIHVLFGMTYDELRLKGKSNEAYKKATEIDPKSAEEWYNKGIAYDKLEKYSDAIKCYDKAHEVAIQLRETEDDIFKDAIDDFIDNIKTNRKDSCVNNYIISGEEFAIESNNEEAIKCYKSAINICQKRAIEDDPRLILIHIALARLYRKMGQDAKSAEQCKLARQLIENESKYNHACCEAVCGSAEEALKLLEIALKENQVQPDWARQDPDFEFIRDDPRFKKLIDEFSQDESSEEK